MAVKPTLLLLDEPFGALDAQVRKELRRWLREIHDRTGYTTVFVTHDQEEALELADRIVVLNKGAIEQSGTPDEIYDNPGTQFVYGFIGQSNSLNVILSNGEIWFDDKFTGLIAASERDGEALLYFRPHDVELTDEPTRRLVGPVTGSRRVAATRHLEVQLGKRHSAVEIELPPEHAHFPPILASLSDQRNGSSFVNKRSRGGAPMCKSASSHTVQSPLQFNGPWNKGVKFFTRRHSHARWHPAFG